MDAYTKLARNAVEEYLASGKIIDPPKNLPKKMLTKKAGVFVSIHEKKSGLPRRHALATRGRRPRKQVSVLRGCIGTFMPTCENIATEIIANAIKSATQDPRFNPISLSELPHLHFSVDILSKPKNVSEVSGLDVQKYGLIVCGSGGRRGLLLPNIPGIDTPEEQLRICLLKAGISPTEEFTLQTFTVERHEETT